MFDSTTGVADAVEVNGADDNSWSTWAFSQVSTKRKSDPTISVLKPDIISTNTQVNGTKSEISNFSTYDTSSRSVGASPLAPLNFGDRRKSFADSRNSLLTPASAADGWGDEVEFESPTSAMNAMNLNYTPPANHISPSTNNGWGDVCILDKLLAVKKPAEVDGWGDWD